MRSLSIFVASLVSLVSLSAIAAPSVEVVSYVYDNAHSNVAELCGRASGITSTTVVHALIDVDGKHPANYNTVVDRDGLFCLTVLTYRGTAALELGGSTVKAPLAKRP